MHKIEGIVFRTLNFRERDQIATVFTAEHGIIKFFIKGAYAAKSQAKAVFPLMLAEFVYHSKKTELWPCQDISLLNPHLFLRQDLHYLRTAFDFISSLQTSQPEPKAAPALYALFLSFLKKIPSFPPLVLQSSFRMKILKHEGLLGLGSICSTCGQPLQKAYVIGGESHCFHHAPYSRLFFLEEERLLANRLAHCHSYGELQTLNVPEVLNEKIKRLFAETFSLPDYQKN